MAAGVPAACNEVEALIPSVATTCVKEGRTPFALHVGQAPTLSLSPRAARAGIREGTAAAMQLIEEIAPFHVKPPYETRTRFAEKGQADWMTENRDRLARTDSKTVGRTSDRVELLLWLRGLSRRIYRRRRSSRAITRPRRALRRAP